MRNHSGQIRSEVWLIYSFSCNRRVTEWQIAATGGGASYSFVGAPGLADFPIARLLESAPGVNASLTQIETWQASVPKVDLSNPQIAALMREQSSSALGGYFVNIDVEYTPPAVGISPNSIGSNSNGPPPLTLAGEAYWVSTSGTNPFSVSNGDHGDATGAQWSAVLSVAITCGFTLGAAIATGGTWAWVGFGAGCTAAILGGQDAEIAVAEQMYGSLQDLFSGAPSDAAANDPTLTDYIMGGANDLVQGFGTPGQSETAQYSQDGSSTTVFSDAQPTGDWGNNDPFVETSGSSDGSGFDAHFLEAYFGGETSGSDISASFDDAILGLRATDISNDMVTSIRSGPSLTEGSLNVHDTPPSTAYSGLASLHPDIISTQQPFVLSNHF